ncbi:unnamed protein product [Chilo suppressalis]|uniref:Uncharacterized protein n=1 Tax=Chilo suppressalis TaxID=168631 RepID=A0ABN8BFQ7_CHISP|nr:unnamed protein product [Chilo suppressalis]
METKSSIIKCHKCRHILLNGYKEKNVNKCDPKKCSSYNLRNFIYLDDDEVPDWIKIKVEEEEWTKVKWTHL